jgi:hypothetical protein
MEELILVTAAALGAFQAAHKQYCHARRDQDGKNALIRRKPMRYRMHLGSPFCAIRPFVEVGVVKVSPAKTGMAVLIRRYLLS